MSEFKLIVAGGRDFNDYAVLSKALWDFANAIDDEVSIISGMAKGADSLAVQWAKENNIELYEFPADWNTHGKSAGYKRNTEMGKAANGAIIFWDGQSKGTNHMINIMKQLNKYVHVINY